MSTMQVIALILAAGSVLIAAIAVPRSSRSSPVRSFSRSVNLAVTAEVDRTVLRRVQARSLSFAGGLVLAAVVLMGLGLAGVEPGATTGIVTVLVVYGSVALCIAVSAGAGRPWVPEGTPRMARVGAARIQDYVPAFELVGARALCGLAVLACIGSAITAGASGSGAVAAWWAGYAAIVVAIAVAWELNARRVLRRSVPAGSTQQLAWNDALRASVLRDTLTLPLTAGFFGAFAGPLHVLTELPLPGWIAAAVGGAVFLLLVAAVLVLIPIALLVKPGRHYQRRLWPELAAAPADAAGPAAPAASSAHGGAR
ncbi:hypothetical protein [Arenivirga flava]|uniref:Uncharacterized protein n=1 Tax=Arenivirga flava TaxID=1930060 RepID=A0AA37UKR4_9MICO|nr:hypothetical protein [Arenivirga flava]GMA29096.1 hypothetical protein GCM10025874_23490 [Arenivirga flava]